MWLGISPDYADLLVALANTHMSNDDETSNSDLDNFLENLDEPPLDIIQELKSDGNNKFKHCLFESVLLYYDRAINVLCLTQPKNKEDEHDRRNLALTLNLNMAACAIKLHKFVESEVLCSLILHFDPKNVKALFRRATAFLNLNEFDKAQVDLSKALSLEPENKAVLKELNNLRIRGNPASVEYCEVVEVQAREAMTPVELFPPEVELCLPPGDSDTNIISIVKGPESAEKLGGVALVDEESISSGKTTHPRCVVFESIMSSGLFCAPLRPNNKREREEDFTVPHETTCLGSTLPVNESLSSICSFLCDSLSSVTQVQEELKGSPRIAKDQGTEPIDLEEIQVRDQDTSNMRQQEVRKVEFTNRKHKNSRLKISWSMYQKLLEGREVSFSQARQASFMTLRVIHPSSRNPRDSHERVSENPSLGEDMVHENGVKVFENIDDEKRSCGLHVVSESNANLRDAMNLEGTSYEVISNNFTSVAIFIPNNSSEDIIPRCRSSKTSIGGSTLGSRTRSLSRYHRHWCLKDTDRIRTPLSFLFKSRKRQQKFPCLTDMSVCCRYFLNSTISAKRKQVPVLPIPSSRIIRKRKNLPDQDNQEHRPPKKHCTNIVFSFMLFYLPPSFMLFNIGSESLNTIV